MNDLQLPFASSGAGTCTSTNYGMRSVSYAFGSVSSVVWLSFRRSHLRQGQSGGGLSGLPKAVLVLRCSDGRCHGHRNVSHGSGPYRTPSLRLQDATIRVGGAVCRYLDSRHSRHDTGAVYRGRRRSLDAKASKWVDFVIGGRQAEGIRRIRDRPVRGRKRCGRPSAQPEVPRSRRSRAGCPYRRNCRRGALSSRVLRRGQCWWSARYFQRLQRECRYVNVVRSGHVNVLQGSLRATRGQVNGAINCLWEGPRRREGCGRGDRLFLFRRYGHPWSRDVCRQFLFSAAACEALERDGHVGHRCRSGTDAEGGLRVVVLRSRSVYRRRKTSRAGHSRGASKEGDSSEIRFCFVRYNVNCQVYRDRY